MVTIHRVVSCFLLRSSQSTSLSRDTLQVAVFHRQMSMPTFPGHWAVISGSIETPSNDQLVENVKDHGHIKFERQAKVFDNSPLDAVKRELTEETNLQPIHVEKLTQHGHFLDVPFTNDKMIRVYPFALVLPDNDFTLEIRGTEHDTYRMVSVAELERLQPTVPGLAMAFHRATFGKYLQFNDQNYFVREWANDHVSGAATMAKQALQLVIENAGKADDDRTCQATSSSEIESSLPISSTNEWIQKRRDEMIMMRPAMVAITNALLQVHDLDSAQQTLESLSSEATQVIDMATKAIQQIISERKRDLSTFRIATFSRSSTLLGILTKVWQSLDSLPHPPESLELICAKSLPGGEGSLMARDLTTITADKANVVVVCVEDNELCQQIRNHQIDLVLVGSDCLLTSTRQLVNKVGTLELAQAVHETRRHGGPCQIVCCTDRFKVWDVDCYPPPIEEDIFEYVPMNLMDQVLCPGLETVLALKE